MQGLSEEPSAGLEPATASFPIARRRSSRRVTSRSCGSGRQGRRHEAIVVARGAAAIEQSPPTISGTATPGSTLTADGHLVVSRPAQLRV
jgi:hypothetical protein